MICIFALVGSASHCAPGPPAAEIEANETPLARSHGKQMPFDCTQKPTNAAIATRPCLISAWRYQPTVASSVSPTLAVRPIGSQKPTTGLSFSESVFRSATDSIFTDAERVVDGLSGATGAKA